MNWLSQDQLQQINPINPIFVVPDSQANQEDIRNAVIQEQYAIAREKKEEYEFGDTSSIHAGGESGRNQLFPDDPIVVNRDSEDLWTLNNGMLETAAKMAKLNPKSANKVATLWIHNPVEARRLCSWRHTVPGPRSASSRLVRLVQSSSHKAAFTPLLGHRNTGVRPE